MTNKYIKSGRSSIPSQLIVLKSHGEENKTHVSNEFFRHMQNRFALTKNTTPGFTFEKRGEVEIKGKGMMCTYFLETNHG